MIDKHTEINDNEIRIISSEVKAPPRKKNKKLFFILGAIAAILLIGVVIAVVLFRNDETAVEETFTEQMPQPVTEIKEASDTIPSLKSYTTLKDTLVNRVALSILTPHNAVPTLEIGNDVLHDSTAVLVMQAADVRGDNGEIAGAFVIKGDLLSKGEAKAGFCSIINGEITVGVADATPMLEQALISGGYFFRQYPLVVGGQLVENKPKGKAMRKAIAEIDGRISVVVSKDRLSFHDFSQALIDAGVRNAIYLVGGESAGFYVDADDRRFSSRPIKESALENVNYIVWR